MTKSADSDWSVFGLSRFFRRGETFPAAQKGLSHFSYFPTDLAAERSKSRKEQKVPSTLSFLIFFIFFSLFSLSGKEKRDFSGRKDRKNKKCTDFRLPLFFPFHLALWPGNPDTGRGEK